MKSKGQFVTGGLHRIGGQIADANAKRSVASGDAPSSALQQEQTQEEAIVSNSQETQLPDQASSQPEQPEVTSKHEASEALRRRHEELRRLKRDILARLAEQRTGATEELAVVQTRCAAIEELRRKCESLAEALSTLPDPQPNAKDYSRAVAEAFRTVENSRLELIMAQTRLEKLPVSSVEAALPGKAGAHSSILPELNSLGRRQLLRFGLFLTAPIAGALLVCGFIIAIAIILAMRGF